MYGKFSVGFGWFSLVLKGFDEFFVILEEFWEPEGRRLYKENMETQMETQGIWKVI